MLLLCEKVKRIRLYVFVNVSNIFRKRKIYKMIVVFFGCFFFGCELVSKVEKIRGTFVGFL